MSEGFNKEYKVFSSAAKKAGFEKDERKLIAMDEQFLLEGVSEEFSKKVTPEMLTVFFKTLLARGEVKSEELVKLGNILYKYRPDRKDYESSKYDENENKKPISFNEAEIKLINLGCNLVEDAFYDNRLSNLKKETAGSLAFVINVLTKIISQSDNQRLKGFDKNRLVSFIEEVSKYEKKEAFKNFENNKKTEAFELEAIEKIEKETDWSSFFQGLIGRSEEALLILEDTELSYAADLFESEIFNLKNSYPRIIEYLRKLKEEVKNNFNKNKLWGQIKHSTPSPFEFAYLSVRSPAQSEARNREISDHRRKEELYKSFKKEYKDEKTDKKDGKKKYNDFSLLGKDLKTEKIPEAIKMLSEFFEGNPEDIFGEFITHLRNFYDVREIITETNDFDNKFSNSKNQILKKINEPSVVPYLIKTSLIMDNLLTDKDNTFTSHPKTWQGGVAEHSFLGEWVVDNQSYELGLINNGPQYAKFHYIQNDVPFVVWSLEYLKSKK